MRIGLDLRMIDGGAGISRYVEELFLSVLKKDRQNKYVLFFNVISPRSKELFGKFKHEMVETKIRHYSYAEQIYLPGIINKYNLDLVHFPHFNVPLFYRKPFIVTIHDLTHTRFPGRKKSHMLHRLAYNLVLTNAIKSSKKIIAVSESTKKEILEFYKISAEKIQVIYEGASQKYSLMSKDEALSKIASKFNITKPFILYAGVWRRYKNLPFLAAVFDKLKEKGLNIQFVLAGSPDPFYPEIKNQVMSAKFKQDLRPLGYVSDEDLNYLYNSATLFVLPSFAEGFGLIALEAAACGTPIACSDIPTLREIMGSAAEYFDPHNLENATDVISGLLNNPTRMEDLANAGLRRIRNYSWEKAGEETIQLYENVNRPFRG